MGIQEFHAAIRSNSLEELREILVSNVDVNAAGELERTALMEAISIRDLEKMKLLVEYGADPELTDRFNTTALKYAVDYDFTEGVRFLLTLGVDRGFHPKYPLKQIDYDFDPLESLEVPIPESLVGLISDEEWASVSNMGDMLKSMGQNPAVEPLIAEVQSIDTLRLFLEVGDDLNFAPAEIKRQYIGLKETNEFRASKSDYRKNKSQQFGSCNPELMNNPFWDDMIRIGCNAYVARQKFGDDDAFANPGAVWCFDRFGSTITQLDDGRFVQIGGEHEDYYDPDFCIYNDVVIHQGNGEFSIYGYPKDVFPPTDFHSATLVGESVYIIGRLGYGDERESGWTPVFRLKVGSWKMEQIQTSGDPPSWLHRHRAYYEASKRVIYVNSGDLLFLDNDGNPQIIPNPDQFELDLKTFQWRKST